MKTKLDNLLGLVGDMYFNNFGVEVYALGEEMVYMRAMKNSQCIPLHFMEIRMAYYLDRFVDNDRCAVENLIDALQFLDPLFQENTNENL